MMRAAHVTLPKNKNRFTETYTENESLLDRIQPYNERSLQSWLEWKQTGSPSRTGMEWRQTRAPLNRILPIRIYVVWSLSCADVCLLLYCSRIKCALRSVFCCVGLNVYVDWTLKWWFIKIYQLTVYSKETFLKQVGISCVYSRADAELSESWVRRSR